MLKVAGKGLRMAGDVLKRGFLSPGKTTVGVGDVAGRLSYDALFGVMNAASTPGDLTDKLISGGMTTLGGGLGGAVLSGGLLRGKSLHGGLRGVTELGGGILGDQLSYGASEKLQGLRSPDGLSPRERQAMEADTQYRAQIEAELIKRLQQGQVDPMLYEQGLGGG